MSGVEIILCWCDRRFQTCVLSAKVPVVENFAGFKIAHSRVGWLLVVMLGIAPLLLRAQATGAPATPAPAVPDGALRGSAPPRRVPPRGVFPRPSRNFDPPIGVFQGQS